MSSPDKTSILRNITEDAASLLRRAAVAGVFVLPVFGGCDTRRQPHDQGDHSPWAARENARSAAELEGAALGKDEKKALAAVRELSGISGGEKSLAKIALGSKSASVRLAAVAGLKSGAELSSVFLNSRDAKVREAALKNMNEETRSGLLTELGNTYKKAMDTAEKRRDEGHDKSADHLEKQGADALSRMMAIVMMITSASRLKEIALDESMPDDVRVQAVKQIKDAKTLEEILAHPNSTMGMRLAAAARLTSGATKKLREGAHKVREGVEKIINDGLSGNDSKDPE